MRSCLEIESVIERDREEIRSDFSRSGVHYGPNTPYVLSESNGGGIILHPNHERTNSMGKGSGHFGHIDEKPARGVLENVVTRRNFDTSPSSGLGNIADNDLRNRDFIRSMYSPMNPYMPKTTLYEGQYASHEVDMFAFSNIM